MSHETITLAEAVQKLYDHRHGNTGHVFTVAFIKRTTGEVRTMNARFKVIKYLKGGSLPYAPKEHDLMGCYDLKSEGYRMINLQGITMLRMEGKTFIIRS